MQLDECGPVFASAPKPRTFGDVMRELKGTPIMLDSDGYITREDLARINAMLHPYGVGVVNQDMRICGASLQLEPIDVA